MGRLANPAAPSPICAAQALIHATEKAQLAVVGARGSGGILSLRLGSVSHALLHHSHCPVAVIHHQAR